MPKKIIIAIVVLLVIVMGLFAYIYISQEFLGKPVGENSIESHWALVIFVVTAILTYYVSRLKILTRVDDKNLTMSLGVIGKRQFALDSIQSVKDYEGNPAADFLGYGYRIAIKQTGYIGRGEQAITLKIQNHKRELVITTDNPEELKKALENSSQG
ncbi:hypothetical protein KS2013_1614 [Kangiella sediminilitoris]|uniref:Bacterial Pleckstrin homology domain-containing protein n=2 Tax=Kangiella sediminilitoris TaxID=1144748 RepID=A0A1B3BBZ2_9GAMM|nr:hypothetical protein KS2013_1614 [Kangiella sediminilitoris]